MAARDPEKTARNKVIDELTAQLNDLLPFVMEETGITRIQSLHGVFGGKYAEYIDIQNAVIHSPDDFIALYLQGFKRKVEERPDSAHARNLELLRSCPKLREYVRLFLKRTYLRNFEALSKKRPAVDQAAVWIGQNNANYGLLVTPRFNKVEGQWENDRSEIRHFTPFYWSVGHVLETGLLVPGVDDRMIFEDAEAYLKFFVNVLVRNSGSKHELAIARMYRDYVLSSSKPDQIPLLIPEFRYDGLAQAHKYRLDFTIIDPLELTRIGFELSPWSSHGQLAGIKGKTQAQVNKMAQDNFEYEMRKHKDFFRKHGVFVLIYTDEDLADLNKVFSDMEKYLEPKSRTTQLHFHLFQEILG